MGARETRQGATNGCAIPPTILSQLIKLGSKPMRKTQVRIHALFTVPPPDAWLEDLLRHSHIWEQMLGRFALQAAPENCFSCGPRPHRISVSTRHQNARVMTRRMQSRTFIKTYFITYNFIWVCSGKSRKGRMQCLAAITQSENHSFCRKETKTKKKSQTRRLIRVSGVEFPFFHRARTRCSVLRVTLVASPLCHFKFLCHLLQRLIWVSDDRRMSCSGGVKDKDSAESIRSYGNRMLK